MDNNTVYSQQGDVLIFPVTELPKGCKKLTGRVVQEGEHTGHAHRLDDGEVFIEPVSKVKYLRIVEPTMLRHEEHKAFTIDPGIYRIGIIVEEDPFSEEIRAIAD